MEDIMMVGQCSPFVAFLAHFASQTTSLIAKAKPLKDFIP